MCRHELFPGYKEQRPAMPAEIKVAIPEVIDILGLLKIPVMRVHGVEADDIIGTLATQAAAEGSHAIIVSSDKVRILFTTIISAKPPQT